MYRSHVLVCGGTGCTSSHSEEIITTLEEQLEEKGYHDAPKVIVAVHSSQYQPRQ